VSQSKMHRLNVLLALKLGVIDANVAESMLGTEGQEGDVESRNELRKAETRPIFRELQRNAANPKRSHAAVETHRRITTLRSGRRSWSES
jgi:adenylate kinase